MLEYELHGKYSDQAAGDGIMAAGAMCRQDMLGYAREANLEDEWKDVMEIAEAALKVAQPPARNVGAQAKNLYAWKTSRSRPAGLWAADDDGRHPWFMRRRMKLE